MIGSTRNGVGDVQKEESKREECCYSDVHLLCGRAEEDAEEHRRRHDARQDHVHNVESVPSAYVDTEGNVWKFLVRAAGEVKLTPFHRSWFDFPFAIFLVCISV